MLKYGSWLNNVCSLPQSKHCVFLYLGTLHESGANDADAKEVLTSSPRTTWMKTVPDNLKSYMLNWRLLTASAGLV